jgi:hypothetical protein
MQVKANYPRSLPGFSSCLSALLLMHQQGNGEEKQPELIFLFNLPNSLSAGRDQYQTQPVI